MISIKDKNQQKTRRKGRRGVGKKSLRKGDVRKAAAPQTQCVEMYWSYIYTNTDICNTDSVYMYTSKDANTHTNTN